MPTYRFLNKDTEEEFEDFMFLAELQPYLDSNPHIKQMASAPAILSGVSGAKPADGFRDVLREIKKKHSQGISKSTVNTF
jgi:hypothetical protein